MGHDDVVPGVECRYTSRAMPSGVGPRESAPMTRDNAAPWSWGAPGTTHVAEPLPGWEDARVLTRAVRADAPADVVHRWLGQLRIAPYSYDLLDNWGRRSPRRLTEDVATLRPGDAILTIFTVRRVGPGHTLVLEVTEPRALRMFGPLLCAYQASPEPDGTTTLRADIFVPRPRTVQERVRLYVLAWGDLVMMRKQLLTLARLSERTAREESQLS